MSKPISPPPATGPRGHDLPAYVSNGLIGLRVRENPLQPGMSIVSGFAGEHHERRVEAAAAVPYPLSGDIALDGLWMSDHAGCVALIDQAYDFATAELTSRFAIHLGERRAEVAVLTFASRTEPTLVCQETTITVDAACDLKFSARIDPEGVRGRMLRRRLDTPGEQDQACDGVLLWGSEGDLGACGLALLSQSLLEAERHQDPWDVQGPLATTYGLRAVKGRRCRFRQLVSLVPSVLHAQPEHQAMRLLNRAGELGFDAIRRSNREAWAEIWQSRIVLEGADERWQALTDAALFYLNSSVHTASPASTSIFGLATWWDYHYYYGHVMWDLDAFAVPPVSLLQPEAARAMLEFRSRGLPAARNNAKLRGEEGLRFPWEAAPSTGEESTPGGGGSGNREDHISLHVARAFGLFADMTGDRRFLVEKAWPVLAGVADWICSRVVLTPDGADWRNIGGPAEREALHDNDATTLMAAKVVLRRAIAAADATGSTAPDRWRDVAGRLAPPLREDGAIADHENYRRDEEQGAAPSPLLGLFPYWAEVDEETAARTLNFYLAQWRDFVGAPMMPALYGTWAAWAGDRDLSLILLEEGYGAYHSGRFTQALEYRLDKVTGGVAAGPFFANIGGFLTGLLLGLPGLKVSDADPSSWPSRPVVLPRGWRAIRCDRLWIRGRPARLVARHGAERAELSFD